MAESGKHVQTRQIELDHILQEARQRWLRPTEICEILRNHQNFQLAPVTPTKPSAGSLFLFNRKAARYFRKDGYRWRKKKDGKTVKEAHEKLKAGSVEVLHCYYAHGEDNENFQRRSYWMLDKKLEHIVLVHYRDVKEGYKSGVSHVVADPTSMVGSLQSSSTPSSAQVDSHVSTVQTSYTSSINRVDKNSQSLASEFEDVDSGEDQRAFSHDQSITGSISHNSPLLAHEATGLLQMNPSSILSSSFPSFYQGNGSSLLPVTHSYSKNTVDAHDQKNSVAQTSKFDLLTQRRTDARLDADSTIQDVMIYGNRLITECYVQSAPRALQTVNQVPKDQELSLVHPQFRDYSDTQVVVAPANVGEQNFKDDDANNAEPGGPAKLDSFVRWMDKEIGRDCDTSVMASDSDNLWNTLDADNEDKEVSSLSCHMQLDMDSLGPSISQEQLFTILDFSPEWAYTGVETKVLIVGEFLESKKPCTEIKWGCMFGKNEVSAEVLTDNVIRCQTPFNVPARVPFYVTCSNRLACSEVREFEYREIPNQVTDSVGVLLAPEDEVRLQMRLVKLLNLGPEKKWLECSITNCEVCKSMCSLEHCGIRSQILEESFMICKSDDVNLNSILTQRLLMDKMFDWLHYKLHDGNKGPSVLDDEGQGVIHLAAALGYEWAMGPLISAGISPNFRDARGRTALHWASYYGREETVIVLVKSGIAGYLAEADLTRDLSTLSITDNVMDNITATIAADKALETAQAILSNVPMDEHLSLKGSLAAVRKSACAAALIQAAFRERSFHQRQLVKSSNATSEAALDLVALGSLNKVLKIGHYSDYLHSAALRIQRKYRGWKERKEFLKIRNRIIQIQARVRGHQVRKQFKRVVWSVGIVEKAILRWRRKGAGLRGFRPVQANGSVASESDKNDEYEFLHIGRKQKSDAVDKALARVKSMVRDHEARAQYMRLLTKFENF
ncbi:Calmodulin-binding transcription activator 2 [Quillaja saponaria]|uniref:Calmodulin-binding transcription activator 2 n=1 Tax=Quillaja saponaria TaxID=32244 RepID=A0AAD7VLX1_QUISA|nr:Calmodulin-binding transcription activator 2 [Quillaja saponaria]